MYFEDSRQFLMSYLLYFQIYQIILNRLLFFTHVLNLLFYFFKYKDCVFCILPLVNLISAFFVDRSCAWTLASDLLPWSEAQNWTDLREGGGSCERRKEAVWLPKALDPKELGSGKAGSSQSHFETHLEGSKVSARAVCMLCEDQKIEAQRS